MLSPSALNALHTVEGLLNPEEFRAVTRPYGFTNSGNHEPMPVTGSHHGRFSIPIPPSNVSSIDSYTPRSVMYSPRGYEMSSPRGNDSAPRVPDAGGSTNHELIRDILATSLKDFNERVKLLESAVAQLLWQQQETGKKDRGFETKLMEPEVSMEQLQPRKNQKEDAIKDINLIVDGSQPADKEGEEEQADMDKREKEEEAIFERELEDSTWDAMVLIGTVGWSSSIFISVSSIITGVMQIVFVLAVSTSSFTGNQLPDIDRIKAWRYGVAHNAANMDELNHISLASLVCDEADTLIMANSQASNLASSRTYREFLPLLPIDTSAGLVLCQLALIMWCCSVQIDLWHGCVQMFLGIWSQPAGRSELRVDIHGDDPSLFVFDGFTTYRRVWLTLCFTIRSALTMSLLYSGVLWLAYTLSVQNLILNATALEFILQIDQMIFAILVKDKTKSIVRRVKPLPLYNAGGIFTGALHPVLAFLTQLALNVFVYFSLLRPQYESLTDMETIMCGGNQNFLYNVVENANMVLATSSHSYKSVNQHPPVIVQHIEGIVQSLTKSGNLSDFKDGVYVPDFGEFSLISHSGYNVISQIFTCDERPAWNDSPNMYQSTLMVMYDQSAKSCADIKHHCDGRSPSNYARTVCPITCGCADPRDGLVARKDVWGCPHLACMATHHHAKALNVPCEDMSLTDLLAHPGWKRYFRHVYDVAIKDNHYIPRVHSLAEVFVHINNSGCPALAYHIQNTDDEFSGRVALCDGENPLGFAGLSIFCPVTCGCTSGKVECPTTCPTSWSNQSANQTR